MKRLPVSDSVCLAFCQEMEIPIFTFVINRLKILLFHLIGYFKRALCCFGRRRRDSNDSVPLTGVGVVPLVQPEIEENWAQWDNTNEPECVLTYQESKQPCDIKEHIELYRQQTMALARRASDEQEAESEANYFEDMAPTITRQKKIYVSNSKKQMEMVSPSLSLGVQMVPMEGCNELGEWVENPGWEDDTQVDCDESVDALVREKRRQERERRHLEQQQRRMERHGRVLPLGARIG